MPPGRTELSRVVHLPAAPYEQDPAKWLNLDWHDGHSGRPVRIVSLEDGSDPDALVQALSGGAVMVETMGRVLGRYIRRFEHKSLASGESPAGPDTVGLLRRRPVCGHPDSTRLIGKEGNQLVERVTGLVDGPSEYRNDYGMVADPWGRVLERLKEIGAPRLVAETGFSRSAVYGVLAGGQAASTESPGLRRTCRIGRLSLSPFAQWSSTLRAPVGSTAVESS